MSAMEKLVADWGIEAVNLRDVGREADQRNNSVVQYHFGSKEQLVGAMLDERLPPLAARVDESLATLHSDGLAGQPDAVAAALVASLLDAEHDERAFVAFLAALISAPRWEARLVGHPAFAASFAHIREAIIAAGVPAEAAGFRLRLAWTMLVSFLASPCGQEEITAARRDELIGAVAGVLRTPVRA